MYDATLDAHIDNDLQIQFNRFFNACNEFGLTVRIKKTNMTPPAKTSTAPLKLELVTTRGAGKKNFTYLGSAISSNLSLEATLNVRIYKASNDMHRLTGRVWTNDMLSKNTKMRIYQACVLSTLLYGSESWALYMRQEHRRNAFHLRNLRKILGITWQDSIPNRDVLTRSNFQVCTSPEDVCAGWDTICTYKMAGSPRTFSMASLPPAPDQLADHFSGSRMSVRETSNQVTSVLLNLTPRLLTEMPGDLQSRAV